jgi:EAL domain-containing protein (putative c-di-GMP-specific phosphodiesterase class I)
LTVEVTEISVVDDEAAADLDVMTKLGIQLTVDDVGTDYSILENLRDHGVNTVKIDPSLIAGLDPPDGTSRSAVEQIIELSRSTGLCTVAEAVETAAQVAVLRELGAETAQGYFFSVPLSAEEAYSLATMNPSPSFALSVPNPAAVPDLPDTDPS